MRAVACCLALVAAACGTERNPNGAEPVRRAVQTANLTGLYQGVGTPPSQICILDRGIGNARFGLDLRDAGGRSCSGAGAAAREGGALRLTMAGDEPCVIAAAIADGEVAFPESLPAGCAYYCGAGAAMAGARFAKVGGDVEDAMRARDLVGDPLCA